MIRKLTLAAGFGAGYLLGAKAGTQRYDQIMGQLRTLAGLPVVKEATDGLQQTASTLADRAKDTVNETIESVNDKLSPGPTVDLTRTSGSMAGAAPSRTAPDLP